MCKQKLSVGIVGATGLIGRTFIKTLEKRNFPIERLKLFATKKSEGEKITAFSRSLTVENTTQNSFDGLDLVFFSAGSNAALSFAKYAEKSGAIVIDNSSAFRNDDTVPLVIPEINGDILSSYSGKIISNPNCSTVQAILPLANIYKEYKLRRLIISTYQAVSGCGQKGINDFLRCKKGDFPIFFPLDISKNTICKIGEELFSGYTDEEVKAERETRKIFKTDLAVSATCVRVPIENCHGVSVEAEFEKPIDIETIKRKIGSTNGVKIKSLPFQTFANKKDEVFVGRIRKSTAFENGIAYFTVSDNTLKGAALNAVEIAEKLIEYKKL